MRLKQSFVVIAAFAAFVLRLAAGYWAVESIPPIAPGERSSYEKLLREVVSPDGRYSAQVWQHDLAVETYVKLYTTDGSWNGEERVVFSARGKKEVQVAWNDGRQLTITGPPMRATHQASTWRDVSIRYR